MLLQFHNDPDGRLHFLDSGSAPAIRPGRTIRPGRLGVIAYVQGPGEIFLSEDGDRAHAEDDLDGLSHGDGGRVGQPYGESLIRH
jgi:hypothetical protein